MRGKELPDQHRISAGSAGL